MAMLKKRRVFQYYSVYIVADYMLHLYFLVGFTFFGDKELLNILMVAPSPSSRFIKTGYTMVYHIQESPT